MPATTPPRQDSPSFVRTPAVRFGAVALRVGLTTAAAAGIIFVHGFQQPLFPLWAIALAQVLLMGAYWADVLIRHSRGTSPLPDLTLDWLDAAMGGLFVVGVVLHIVLPSPGTWMIAEAAIVWTLIAELWRLYAALSRQLKRPGILMPLSFVVLIGVGTILLKAPVAMAPTTDVPLSWLDSAFTITSAVCVTGLVVRDTAHDFSPLGQTIIGIFIQLGGLGVIVFGSMLVLMLGESVTMRGARQLSEMLQNEPVDRLRRSTRFIVLGTLVIPLTGAVVMYPMWHAGAAGAEELTPTRRVGLSLFHAVSAFCNAGFDTLGTSLVTYRNAALTHLVIAPLIVLGGLGFPVLQNLADVARSRARAFSWRAVWRRAPFRIRKPLSPPVRMIAIGRPPRPRLTLHTRLVLVTTLGLYAWGVLTIGSAQLISTRATAGDTTPLIVQPQPATAPPSGVVGALADASFMSVSARTAGFNSRPREALAPASRFSLITLMIVGGSPGGAAGGFKTTVLAVLLWSVFATIRQRRETEVFKRTISDAVVRQAGTVAICYIMLIVVATMLLSLSEEASFGVVFFEAVSAASTTGLSLGLTPHLTPFGKVVIILTMFLGRVGPLALFASLAFQRGPQRPYAYPHESVALG